MFFITHIFSSVIVLYIFSLIVPSVQINSTTIILSMIFAYLPDIDSIWAKKLNNHSKKLPHIPIFWVAVSLIGFIAAILIPQLKSEIVLLLLVQTLAHLLFDYITARCAGLMLLYPFSEKEFHLFPLQHKKGGFYVFDVSKYKNYLKFYAENKPLLLFEIVILFLGIIMLI